MNESTSQGKSKIISLEELKAKPKAYEKISRIISNQHNLAKSTSAYDENYGVTIVTDQILLYEYSGYESLTFSVYPDEDRGFVENIILVKEQDGEYTAYYIMYNFTDDEKLRLAAGENITFDHEDYCGVPLDEFDNGTVMKSGGDIYSVSGIYERDGKCYRIVVYRVTVFSTIPGQKEYSEFQTAEVEVDCPQQDVDYSYGDNGGGGDPPAPDFGHHTGYYNPGSLPGSYTGPGRTGSNPIFSSPVIFDLLKNSECKKINNHMNSVFSLREKLTDLATKVNESNEKGFGMTQNGGTLEFNTNLPNGDIIFTSPPGTVYNVISHTHTAGKLSVFSMADLEAIGKFIRGGYINDETNTFIATLSTEKGTHYVLLINDMTKFKEFFFYKVNTLGELDMNGKLKYSASDLRAQELEKKYYGGEDPRISITETDNEKTLLQFLKMMSEARFGVSLFETDANFQSFSKLSTSFSGNSITRNPCD